MFHLGTYFIKNFLILITVSLFGMKLLKEGTNNTDKRNGFCIQLHEGDIGQLSRDGFIE